MAEKKKTTTRRKKPVEAPEPVEEPQVEAAEAERDPAEFVWLEKGRTRVWATWNDYEHQFAGEGFTPVG
jgi:hypothetical protein